ncbi:PilN domain-containing protein [Alteribacter aurantiacus]|uniref:PilN domain-containing protein n=1 Tax=Alteribacter aurantiacus TaxID=254410 RepID=UPI0003FF1604|nr:hypothetical protein [Alteribacter aurantiacus]
MPVEINLLPKKERKDRSLLYVIGGLLLACFVASAIFAVIGSQVESELAVTEAHLQETRIASAEVQAEIHTLSNADQERLSLYIETLEDKAVPSSAVVHDIVSRMPPEGYLVEFDYAFPFDVYLEAAFYEMRDLAYYHQSLEESALISEVTLHFVDGEDVFENEEEEDATTGFFTQTNTTQVYLPHYTAGITVTLDPQAVRAHGDEEETEPPTGTEPGPPVEDEDDENVNIDIDVDVNIETEEGNGVIDLEMDDNGEVDLDLEMNTEENGGDDQ